MFYWEELSVPYHSVTWGQERNEYQPHCVAMTHVPQLKHVDIIKKGPLFTTPISQNGEPPTLKDSMQPCITWLPIHMNEHHVTTYLVLQGNVWLSPCSP